MNPLMNAILPKQGNNLMQVMQMLQQGDPEQIAEQMLQSNPKFKQFMEMNKGKTPEQVARENGIDLNALMRQFK